MFCIPWDYDKMSEQDKKAAVEALKRIMAPAKGMHLPTLVAMTAQSFDVEKDPKK